MKDKKIIRAPERHYLLWGFIVFDVVFAFAFELLGYFALAQAYDLIYQKDEIYALSASLASLGLLVLFGILSRIFCGPKAFNRMRKWSITLSFIGLFASSVGNALFLHYLSKTATAIPSGLGLTFFLVLLVMAGIAFALPLAFYLSRRKRKERYENEI